MVVALISVLAVGIYALTINQNEQRQLIPANVGLSGCITGAKPLHTHDATGTIHVETDENRDYTVGDFFLVWGKVFNSSGVFPYNQALPSYLDRCVTGSLVYHTHPTLTIIFKKFSPSTISMTVNGSPEPLMQAYVFPRDTAVSPASIVITYGPGVPASF